MLISGLASGAMALAAVFWMGFPFVNRQLDAMIIAAGPYPHPSGPYEVGFVSRALPVIRDVTGTARDVPVDFWYPVPRNSGHVPATSSGRRSFWQTPRTVGNEGAPVSAEVDKWPVILFAPGWGGSRTDNTFLFSELASKGFVVASVDDIGTDAEALKRVGVAIDGAASTDPDFSTPAAVTRTQKVAEDRVHLMVGKLRGLLDVLSAQEEQGQKWLLAGRLAVREVGVAGFSIGGSAAAEAPLHDKRFVASVNMDGWLIGKSLVQRVPVPFLTLNSDFPQLESWSKSSDLGKRTAAGLTVHDRQLQHEQARSPTSYMLFFKGVDHADFTDSLFGPSVKAYVKRWWRTSVDWQRLWEFIAGYQVAFFERHLRGDKGQKPILDDPLGSPAVSRLGQDGK